MQRGARHPSRGITRSHVKREFEGEYPDARNDGRSHAVHALRESALHRGVPTVEGATYKRDDGIVVVDKEKCIGCKACIAACPYGARYYCESEQGYFGSDLNEYEEVMYAAMPQGTVDKCTFCAERIDAGGNQPQACVAACVAGARVFGDLDTLKKQAEEGDGYQLLPDEGTNPSVWYLPHKVNE